MKKPFFTGVGTALVTPYLNGAVNYPMLEQLLRRQVDAGIPAIILCGTTGESPVLSDEEKLNMFLCAKKYVGSSCKIIAGTGSNSTEHAVQFSKAAEETGVDGLLIVSPYYNKATQDGIIKHYQAISDAVDLPIIAYNVPSRTGLDISVHTYQALSSLPNMVGVKEASEDITKVSWIRRFCPAHFFVWAGNDAAAVPVISLGGAGVISVLSNIFPAQAAAMINAAITGDFAKASSLQSEFMPLIKMLFFEVNPIPVKAAMRMIGYDCGDCRLPLTPLSEENANTLKAILSGYQF